MHCCCCYCCYYCCLLVMPPLLLNTRLLCAASDHSATLRRLGPRSARSRQSIRTPKRTGSARSSPLKAICRRNKLQAVHSRSGGVVVFVVFVAFMSFFSCGVENVRLLSRMLLRLQKKTGTGHNLILYFRLERTKCGASLKK